jgi:hypothetical protein
MRRTTSQYHINQAVHQGVERQKLQAGPSTFGQRFGSAIHLNLHYHAIFFEGVYLDRSAEASSRSLLNSLPPVMPTLLPLSRRSASG